MWYDYQLCEESLWDESGLRHTVYGVRVVDSSGVVLAAYPDVYFEREKAEHLVQTCNQCRLEPVHLADVVADAIQREHML